MRTIVLVLALVSFLSFINLVVAQSDFYDTFERLELNREYTIDWITRYSYGLKWDDIFYSTVYYFSVTWWTPNWDELSYIKVKHPISPTKGDWSLSYQCLVRANSYTVYENGLFLSDGTTDIFFGVINDNFKVYAVPKDKKRAIEGIHLATVEKPIYRETPYRFKVKYFRETLSIYINDELVYSVYLPQINLNFTFLGIRNSIASVPSYPFNYAQYDNIHFTPLWAEITDVKIKDMKPPVRVTSGDSAKVTLRVKNWLDRPQKYLIGMTIGDTYLGGGGFKGNYCNDIGVYYINETRYTIPRPACYPPNAPARFDGTLWFAIPTLNAYEETEFSLDFWFREEVFIAGKSYDITFGIWNETYENLTRDKDLLFEGAVFNAIDVTKPAPVRIEYTAMDAITLETYKITNVTANDTRTFRVYVHNYGVKTERVLIGLTAFGEKLCNQECYETYYVYPPTGEKWCDSFYIAPGETRFGECVFRFKPEILGIDRILDVRVGVWNWTGASITIADQWDKIMYKYVIRIVPYPVVPPIPPYEGGQIELVEYPFNVTLPIDSDVTFVWKVRNNGTVTLSYRIGFTMVEVFKGWTPEKWGIIEGKYCNDYCFKSVYDNVGLTGWEAVPPIPAKFIVVHDVYPGEERTVTATYTLKPYDPVTGQGFTHGNLIDLPYTLKNLTDPRIAYDWNLITDAFRVIKIPPNGTILKIIYPQEVPEDGIADIEFWVKNTGNITHTFLLGLTIGYDYDPIGLYFVGNWCNELCYEADYDIYPDGTIWVGFVKLSPGAVGKDLVKFKFRKEIFKADTFVDIAYGLRDWDKNIIESNYSLDAIKITLPPEIAYGRMAEKGINAIVSAMTVAFKTDEVGGKFILWTILTLAITGVATYGIGTVVGGMAWQFGVVMIILLIILGSVIGFIPPWIAIVFVIIAGFIMAQWIGHFISGGR